MIERQYPGGHLWPCQQRFQPGDLGKRRDDRFFDHNTRDRRRQRLLKHLKVLQRCGSDKQRIEVAGKKVGERRSTGDAIKVFCWLDIESQAAKGRPKGALKCG